MTAIMFFVSATTTDCEGQAVTQNTTGTDCRMNRYEAVFSTNRFRAYILNCKMKGLAECCDLRRQYELILNWGMKGETCPGLHVPLGVGAVLCDAGIGLLPRRERPDDSSHVHAVIDGGAGQGAGAGGKLNQEEGSGGKVSGFGCASLCREREE